MLASMRARLQACATTHTSTAQVTTDLRAPPQEPPEGWACLPLATPADQLGSAFDSGPAYTGAAVTALLSHMQLPGGARGAGDGTGEESDDCSDDEWALLDLRVPAARVVGVRPDGGLSLEDSSVLPAFLALPQRPVHVQLQPQQPGQEGPGVGCLGARRSRPLSIGVGRARKARPRAFLLRGTQRAGAR